MGCRRPAFQAPNTSSNNKNRALSGDLIINPDVLYRLNEEEVLHLQSPQDPDGKEGNECLSAGFPFLKPDICLRTEGESSSSHHLGAEGETSIEPSSGHEMIASVVSFHIKEEGETCSMEHEDPGRLESITTPTRYPVLQSDFCLRNEDEPAVSVIGHPSTGGGESSTDPVSGHVVIPEVVLVRIKEEGQTYSIDQQDCEIIKTISSPTGIGSMNKQTKVEESVTCTEKRPHYHATPGKANVKVPKNKRHRMPVWSERNWKLGWEETTQYESGFINSPYFNLHQENSKPGRSDKYKEYESKLSYSQFLKGPPSTPQSPRTFSCTECDKSYSLKGELIRHMITHSGVRPYPCTECGKSFFQMPHLVRHHRTHSGEKPYSCSFCHKRFNRKDNLNGHERIHTGERPYKCNECEKRFIRKSDLNEHRRKHI